MAAIISPALGTNLSEWLKIQKRETPSCGPSFTNSCPSPLPHLPQRTCNCSTYSVNLSFRVRRRADPLAPPIPCRQSESPSSWWRCRLEWFPWTPAKGTSGETWSGWRTAGGCTGSTRIFLQGAVGSGISHSVFKTAHFRLWDGGSPSVAHWPIPPGWSRLCRNYGWSNVFTGHIYCQLL